MAIERPPGRSDLKSPQVWGGTWEVKASNGSVTLDAGSVYSLIAHNKSSCQGLRSSVELWRITNWPAYSSATIIRIGPTKYGEGSPNDFHGAEKTSEPSNVTAGWKRWTTKVSTSVPGTLSVDYTNANTRTPANFGIETDIGFGSFVAEYEIFSGLEEIDSESESTGHMWLRVENQTVGGVTHSRFCEIWAYAPNFEPPNDDVEELSAVFARKVAPNGPPGVNPLYADVDAWILAKQLVDDGDNVVFVEKTYYHWHVYS